MEYYDAKEYDIAVIGGGHAGCEAALAAARLGCSTIIVAINLDAIANMACNPNIGGTAKGHLVREIDALGGEMGRLADECYIQTKMLNLGKGPAVYSLRAQVDRREYQKKMKHCLEKQDGLDIKQAEIVEIRLTDGKVSHVVTNLGAVYKVKAAIIATGTFLKGKIIIGEVQYPGGPDGLFPSNSLSDCLRNLGVELRRFKTGTPTRINGRSVNYSLMEEQRGDEKITPFSFQTKNPRPNQALCYLTYTNEKTHKIIRDNLHRAPLYNHSIEGTGPRYCPSIEDKVVRFFDKERHQVFIEPMGLETEEMYVQGMSTSLPEDLQIEILHSIKGLEAAQIMRSAYAIEYDCCNPTDLYRTLEFKKIGGLYGAGQFNGSSGYEEAAAQGLMAGINAARKINGMDAVVIDRAMGYIGVLIDDLTTKGTDEPYRMLTSRAEYRLLLRQDNADLRLTPLGYEIGLISEGRYQHFVNKKSEIEKEVLRCETTNIAPTKELLELLKSRNSTAIITGIKLAELIRRPELDYFILKDIDKGRQELSDDVTEEVNVYVKYDGYVARQMRQVESFRSLERKLLKDVNYQDVYGLRIEARQKLDAVKPDNIGQASRIPGVSPADISVLLIYLQQKGGKSK